MLIYKLFRTGDEPSGILEISKSIWKEGRNYRGINTAYIASFRWSSFSWAMSFMSIILFPVTFTYLGFLTESDKLSTYNGSISASFCFLWIFLDVFSFSSWQTPRPLLYLSQLNNILLLSTMGISSLVSCRPKLANNSEDIFFASFLFHISL